MSAPARSVPPAVTEALTQVLRPHDDGLALRDVLRRLRDDPATARVPRRVVEQALAEETRFLERDAAGRTWWVLDPSHAPTTAVRDAGGDLTPAVAADRPLDGLDLRDWQVEAFAALSKR